MIVKTAVQQQWNIIFPGSGPGYTIFKPVDKDGEKWYTMLVNKDIAAWIKSQHKDQWYQHLDEPLTQLDRHQTKFDVHYELLTFLKLTWGS